MHLPVVVHQRDTGLCGKLRRPGAHRCDNEQSPHLSVKPIGPFYRTRTFCALQTIRRSHIAYNGSVAGAGPVEPAVQPVDLFLSYNRLDHDVVDAFCAQLRARGIHAFLDRDSLTPGLPWPQALESALISARAVAVFLGPHGLGGWQRREMSFALDLQVAAEKAARTYPVIPVLLKGADPAPSFLMVNTAIDLRSDQSIDLLLKTLGGAPPLALSPAQAANIRPYVGLHAFREEDSGFFFGRDTFVDRLFEAVKHHRVVAAVGPSGCGKSSVVFAGLLPRLRRQRPPNRTWEIASFTPGVYPWRRLADALVPLIEPDASEVERIARAGDLERALTGRAGALVSTVDRIQKISGGSDRLLLVVDQFEEIFTLTPAADRAAFLEVLLQAVNGAPLSIVLTLRADFYGRALESSRTLSDFLGRATVPIGPLLPAELKQAIEAPVLKAGGRFEPGLVDLIAEDVLSQPGQLPLLEYALAELWSRCSTPLARPAPPWLSRSMPIAGPANWPAPSRSGPSPCSPRWMRMARNRPANSSDGWSTLPGAGKTAAIRGGAPAGLKSAPTSGPWRRSSPGPTTACSSSPTMPVPTTIPSRSPTRPSFNTGPVCGSGSRKTAPQS